ncbi:response regulator [Neobacillus mesonae]|uniref:response regulator n=1 Tax=Neobacillus mesonae TaxID=1193713 RepID=UPI002573B4DF|nr:response regulator transcription factor [Neobacillus mesonae]
MKVLIVDDHILIRKGIRFLLEKFTDIQVVGEARDGSEAITLALKEKPDIILMDLSMPDGLDGFSAAQTILFEAEQVKIIALSTHDEEIYVRKALKHGIHGYLLKNSHSNELFDAMKAVYNGKRFYRTKVPEHQFKRLSEEEDAASVLTVREQEIVRLTSLGYTNIQIGKQLGISPKTVENHKANIMRKLGFKEKHELVKYAINNKLIDLF